MKRETKPNLQANQFVPYKFIGDLRELGFNQDTLLTIHGGNNLFLGGWDWDDEREDNDVYEYNVTTEPMFLKDGNNCTISNPKYEQLIPLWQQCFDWFEEVFKVSVVLTPKFMGIGKPFIHIGYHATVYDLEVGSSYNLTHSEDKYELRCAVIDEIIAIAKVKYKSQFKSPELSA